ARGAGGGRNGGDWGRSTVPSGPRRPCPRRPSLVTRAERRGEHGRSRGHAPLSCRRPCASEAREPRRQSAHARLRPRQERHCHRAARQRRQSARPPRPLPATVQRVVPGSRGVWRRQSRYAVGRPARGLARPRRGLVAMRSSRLLGWLSRTPVQTFLLCPLLVVAFELVRQGEQLTIVPAGFALLAWGYLQYRLVGGFLRPLRGGAPGRGVPA